MLLLVSHCCIKMKLMCLTHILADIFAANTESKPWGNCLLTQQGHNVLVKDGLLPNEVVSAEKVTVMSRGPAERSLTTDWFDF